MLVRNIFKPLSVLIIATVTLLFSNILPAYALPTFWNLPKEINDSNTKINFIGESTWCTLRGVTSNINGRAWLEDPRDFHSIRGEITLPIRSLDTNDESHNEKLWRVMSEDRYKLGKFLITKVDNLCNPIEMAEGSICNTIFSGKLTLLKTTKDLEIPVQIRKNNHVFKLTSEFIMDWRDYEIEDPSILINKVEPLVKISLELFL